MNQADQAKELLGGDLPRPLGVKTVELPDDHEQPLFREVIPSAPDQDGLFSNLGQALGKAGHAVSDALIPSAQADELTPGQKPSTPGATGEERKPAPDLHPTVTLEFDGKAFRAIDDGKVVKTWPAVSGRPGFQGAEHQSEKDIGPLPEGEWVLRQDRLQTIDQLSGFERFRGHFGGSTPGSGGCIDLTDQMDDFADYFRRMGKDVTVRVQYPHR